MVIEYEGVGIYVAEAAFCGKIRSTGPYIVKCRRHFQQQNRKLETGRADVGPFCEGFRDHLLSARELTLRLRLVSVDTLNCHKLSSPLT